MHTDNSNKNKTYKKNYKIVPENITEDLNKR